MKRAICSLLLLAGAAVTPADAAGFTVLSGDQNSLSFVYR